MKPLLIDFSCGDCKKKDAEIERLNTELAQARADRWIPVDERLPDIHDVVLIAVRNRSQACEGYLTEKNEWRVWGGVYPYFTAATHWRPLPTPPEQEERPPYCQKCGAPVVWCMCKSTPPEQEATE